MFCKFKPNSKFFSSIFHCIHLFLFALCFVSYVNNLCVFSFVVLFVGIFPQFFLLVSFVSIDSNEERRVRYKRFSIFIRAVRNENIFLRARNRSNTSRSTDINMSWIAQPHMLEFDFCFVQLFCRCYWSSVCSAIRAWFHNLVMCNRFFVVVDFIIYNSYRTSQQM